MESSPFVGTFTIGETVDKGFKLLKLHTKEFVKSLLVIMPIFLIYMGIIAVPSMNGDMQDPSKIGSWVTLFFIGFSTYMLGFSYVLIAYVKMISASIETGQKNEFFTHLKTVKFFQAIRFLFGSVFTYIIVSFSFLLLIVPGIYLINAFPTYLFKGVREDKYHPGVLFDTLGLMKGKWWNTAWLNSVASIIMIVLMFVIYIPNIALEFLIEDQAYKFLLTAVSSIIVMPFGVIVGSSIYCIFGIHFYKLLSIRDGFHLEKDIESFGDSDDEDTTSIPVNL